MKDTEHARGSGKPYRIPLCLVILKATSQMTKRLDRVTVMIGFVGMTEPSKNLSESGVREAVHQ